MTYRAIYGASFIKKFRTLWKGSRLGKCKNNFTIHGHKLTSNIGITKIWKKLFYVTNSFLSNHYLAVWILICEPSWHPFATSFTETKSINWHWSPKKTEFCLIFDLLDICLLNWHCCRFLSFLFFEARIGPLGLSNDVTLEVAFLFFFLFLWSLFF